MWIGFNAIVAVMLLIDLGLNRKSHKVSFREALGWSAVWVALAAVFGAGVYLTLGSAKGVEFFTGYVIEKTLSVDNLFVFLLIFSAFSIPDEHQPKILKWGIIGALVMRAFFIFAGVELLETFHWTIYLFGGILILTGIKMAFGGESKMDPQRNLLVRLVGRFMPIVQRTDEGRFFVREKGALAATPLFLALVAVESSDLIFAVDSIPAIFAVTRDPFIVYTSNVFAILGLRSLYFLLAGMVGKFVYLKPAISLILTFVGVKMILSSHLHIPGFVSLSVIAAVLIVAVLASLVFPRPTAEADSTV